MAYNNLKEFECMDGGQEELSDDFSFVVCIAAGFESSENQTKNMI